MLAPRAPFLMLLVLALTGSATEAGNNFLEQRGQLRLLRAAVRAYHSSTGQYPQTDASGTWFQKLQQRNLIKGGEVWTDKKGVRAVDYFGHLIVYETPAPANNQQLIIRAVGRNGVDDGGRKDDWDAGHAPNLGYWYKRHWPAVRRWGAIGGLALALGGFVGIFLWLRRTLLTRLALMAVYLGLLASGAIPLWFALNSNTAVDADPAIVGIEPGWVTPLTVLGALSLLAGMAMLLAAAFRHAWRYWRDDPHAPEGRCINCGYDLRCLREQGIDRCPECGQALDSPAPLAN